MDFGIAGKTAIVTGAARGLGREDALKLAGEGVNVAVIDLNEKGAIQTAEDVAKLGVKAVAYKLDISDRKAVKEIVAKVAEDLGAPTILVNNASVLMNVSQVKSMNDDMFDLDLKVNLGGTYNVTKAVLPHMIAANWGRVVSMSSVAGTMGGFGQAGYSATKMGTIGLAKTVALEGAKYNITSNAIVPGIIGTDILKMSPLLDRMRKRVALGKEGDPEDIANTVVFLCSQQAKYITGAAIHVTGGLDLFTF